MFNRLFHRTNSFFKFVMQSCLDKQAAISDKIWSKYFLADKIFDPFFNVLLSMTSWQLRLVFQSYIITAKIVPILAMLILVDLQEGIWSRTCPNLMSTKKEIKFKKFLLILECFTLM